MSHVSNWTKHTPPYRASSDIGADMSNFTPPHCTMGDAGEIKSSTKPPDCTTGDLGVDKVAKTSIGGKNVTPDPEKFLSSNIQKTNDFWVNLHKTVSKVEGPNAFGARVKIPTSIKTEFLARQLENYPDAQIVEFFKYGWPVGAVGEIRMQQKKWPKNHDSAVKFPQDIDDFIAKGFAKNSIIGPFDNNPFDCDIGISPLASREKSDSTERRVFLNMS